MTDSRFTLTHRFLLAAIVLAVASLGACGGSSDSTSSDDSNGPVVDGGGAGDAGADNGGTDSGGAGNDGADDFVATGSSTDCFNEAMYRTGSTWTIKTESTGTSPLGGGPVTIQETETTTVNGPKTFKGHSAMEIEYGEPGSSEKSFDYSAVAGGKIIQYGYQNQDADTGNVTTAWFVPPLEIPTSMTPNQIYVLGPVALEMDLGDAAGGVVEPMENTTTARISYLGQETITVPAGTFVACKGHEVTENKSVTRVSTPAGDMSITNLTVVTSDTWTVASGPYRGLLVQSIGKVETSTSSPVSGGQGQSSESSFESKAIELSASFK